MGGREGMNQDLQKSSEKFECKIQNLEQLFEKGKTIDSIESFRHHASVWYELGYTVGKLEGISNGNRIQTTYR